MALTPAMFIRVHVLDMSQKSLAAELDVTQPRVSKWESTPGQIPKKHHDTVKKLAAKKKDDFQTAILPESPSRASSGFPSQSLPEATQAQCQGRILCLSCLIEHYKINKNVRQRSAIAQATWRGSRLALSTGITPSSS